MKPSNKNRIYCPACNKHKLLFETEDKALRFIKFNSDAMLEETGVAPIRAYFCAACGGFHVTHQEKLPTREEILMDKMEEISNMISDSINDIETYIETYSCDINDIDSIVTDYVHYMRGYIKLIEEFASDVHKKNYEYYSKTMSSKLTSIAVFNANYADTTDGVVRIEKFNIVKKLANMIKGLNPESSKLCDDIISIANQKIYNTAIMLDNSSDEEIEEVKSIIRRVRKNMKYDNYYIAKSLLEKAKRETLKLSGSIVVDLMNEILKLNKEISSHIKIK